MGPVKRGALVPMLCSGTANQQETFARFTCLPWNAVFLSESHIPVKCLSLPSYVPRRASSFTFDWQRCGGRKKINKQMNMRLRPCLLMSSTQLHENSITEHLPPSPSAGTLTGRGRAAPLRVREPHFRTADSGNARCSVSGRFRTGSWTAPPSSLPPGWPRAEKRPAGLKMCDLQPAWGPVGAGDETTWRRIKDKDKNKQRNKLTHGRVGEKKRKKSLSSITSFPQKEWMSSPRICTRCTERKRFTKFAKSFFVASFLLPKMSISVLSCSYVNLSV